MTRLTYKQSREAPSEAPGPLRASARTVKGLPCIKCGGTRRRPSNGQCYDCKQRQRRERPRVTNGKVCEKHPELEGRRRNSMCVGCLRERAPTARARKDPVAHRRAVMKWREKNAEKHEADKRGRVALRRAIKKAATIGDPKTVRRAFAELSQEARRLGLVIDHSVPLRPCRVCGAKGTHEPSNWQLLDRRANESKGNRCMTCWSQAADA